MDWILLLAAFIVVFLLLGFVVRAVKAAIGTAVMIALVLIVLQVVFGFSPNQLWQEMVNLWQGLWRQFR
jgi:carbon starvation protein CstA